MTTEIFELLICFLFLNRFQIGLCYERYIKKCLTAFLDVQQVGIRQSVAFI